ncbi:MAG: tetratricopeptide repeat protein [Deltaproteobacteria bacterium]|nr:tetratricopeptide repeat protein [Deltaproteobacteria bacterium]
MRSTSRGPNSIIAALTLRAVATTTLFFVAMAILSPSPVFAGKEARIYGKVLDQDGKPIPHASIHLTTRDQDLFKQTLKVNKKGRYSALIADSTFRYTFAISKEGFETAEVQVSLPLDGTVERDFTLQKAGASAAAAHQPAAPVGGAAAIKLYNEGIAAYQEGDKATARTKLEAAIEKEADLAQAHGVLALLLRDQGDQEGALAAADRALALKPQEATALQARYDALKALGRGDDAKAAAEALAAAGQNADAAKRVYNDGVAAVHAEDPATALAKFEEAGRLDPNLTQAHVAVAGLYFSQQRYEEAAQAAERTLDLDPANLKALKVRYESYRSLKNTEKAQEALTALAANDPEIGPQAFRSQGVSLFNQNQMPAAIEAFEQAVAIDPNDAKSYYHLGLAYVNTGETAKAKENFTKFLELAPEDPDAGTAREMVGFL